MSETSEEKSAGPALMPACVYPADAGLPPPLVADFAEAGWDLSAEWEEDRVEATLRARADGLLLVFPPGLTAAAWQTLPALLATAQSAGWHCAGLMAADLTIADAENLAAGGLEEVWLAGEKWGSLVRRARALAEERRARATASLLSQAMEFLPCGVTIADMTQADNPLIYANEGFRRMTGFTDAEIMRRNCRFLQGERRDENASSVMRQGIRAGKPVRIVLTNYRRDGSAFKNELSMRPLRDARGRVTHYVGVQNDITSRLALERELREKSARLLSIANALPVKLWASNGPNGAGTFCYNAAWAEVFGRDVHEIPQGAPDWREHLYAEERDAIEVALAQAARDGGRVGFDARLRMRGGGDCWHHFSSVIETKDKGGNSQVVGAAWDISLARSAQDELARSLGILSLRLFVIRQAVQQRNGGLAALLRGSFPAAVAELLQCGSLRVARFASGRRIEPAGAWDGDAPAFEADGFSPCRMEDLLGDAWARLADGDEPLVLPVAAVARLGARSGAEIVAVPLGTKGAGALFAAAFRPPPTWAGQCQDELRAIAPALAAVAAPEAH